MADPKINKLMFCGRLAADPDLRHTQNGTPVCNIRLLQNSRLRDPETGKWGEGDPIPVDVAIWGKRGEAFAEHHIKGQLAFIEGKLRHDSWTTDGQRYSRLKVDADSWEFMPQTTRVSDGPFPVNGDAKASPLDDDRTDWLG